MTWQFATNTLYTSAITDFGIILYDWLTFLYGHSIITVLGSGDGAAAWRNTGEAGAGSAGGAFGANDVFTNFGAWNNVNNNDWGRLNAWIRIQWTASGEEWIIQRWSSGSSSNQRVFNIVYAPDGFDNTGVANATTPPTASGDSYTLLNTALYTYGVDVRANWAVDDAAQDGRHAWWFAISHPVGGTIEGFMFQDVVEDKITNDTKPNIICVRGQNAGERTLIQNSTFGFYPRSDAPYSYTFENIRPLSIGNSGTFVPDLIAVTPDGEDRTFPIFYGHANGLYKGKSRNFRWKSTAGRNWPDTVDLATANARAYIGTILVPWEQGVTPI